MNVIQFPAKPYVLITSQMITEVRDGSTCVRHDPPARVFLLELIEADGRTIVWDGTNYFYALVAANEWVVDNVEVRDRVAEIWGRA